jgi:hypothetical protein
LWKRNSISIAALDYKKTQNIAKPKKNIFRRIAVINKARMNWQNGFIEECSVSLHQLIEIDCSLFSGFFSFAISLHPASTRFPYLCFCFLGLFAKVSLEIRKDDTVAVWVCIGEAQ